MPDDHQVHQIAAVLDLSWVRAELAPHDSPTGRPSIDPELMIRMLILGYVFAIRSERALCREVQLNLAYRWFCAWASKTRFPIIPLSRALATIASASAMFFAACSRASLKLHRRRSGRRQGFAVDASLIAADANKCRSTPGGEWSHDIDPATVERAVQDYLANLDRKRKWNQARSSVAVLWQYGSASTGNGQMS